MTRRVLLPILLSIAGAFIFGVLFNIGHLAYVNQFEPNRWQGYRAPLWDFAPFLLRTAIASSIGLVVGAGIGFWMRVRQWTVQRSGRTVLGDEHSPR